MSSEECWRGEKSRRGCHRRLEGRAPPCSASAHPPKTSRLLCLSTCSLNKRVRQRNVLGNEGEELRRVALLQPWCGPRRVGGAGGEERNCSGDMGFLKDIQVLHPGMKPGSELASQRSIRLKAPALHPLWSAELWKCHEIPQCQPRSPC